MAADPLARYRDRFHIPPAPGGSPSIYLTGNSLGCQPKGVRDLLVQELDDWAKLGVEGHLEARDPWLSYHEQFRQPLGRIVGGLPNEVVAMNSLTVNLHLLMVSFYRPTRERFKIVIEDAAFPSDSYAVQSQAKFHSHDPAKAIVRLKPREGEFALRTEDVEAFLDRDGKTVALVMLGAVNYLTGQWFDMQRITAAAKSQGCARRLGSPPTPPATSRCSFTTGTSTSRHGAVTSTSTQAPARSRARLFMRSTLAPTGRALQAGGVTIRRRASR